MNDKTKFSDLDLSGLGADPLATGELTLSDLEDPTTAKELQFLSGSLDFDEHMKEATIRMDAILGEIADQAERQTQAFENIATGFERLLELLEPVAKAFAPENAELMDAPE